MEEINFELKRNVKDKKNINLFLFTVYYENNIFDEVLNRNLKLDRLEKLIIFVPTGFEKKYEDEKIELLEIDDLEDINEITYYDIFNEIYKKYKGKNCIVCRSDIFLLNNRNLEFLNVYLEKNNFLCLSSILYNPENDNLSKNTQLMRSFYSTSQDCWIFNFGKEIDLSCLKEILFNINGNETEFNYYLSKYYDLLNDTETFKILLYQHENNDNLRKNNDKELKNKLLLPETTIMNKMNFENLLKYLKLNEKEIYKLKCKIITEYSKNIE
jgi:hypothetical protein